MSALFICPRCQSSALNDAAAWIATCSRAAHVALKYPFEPKQKAREPATRRTAETAPRKKLREDG